MPPLLAHIAPVKFVLNNANALGRVKHYWPQGDLFDTLPHHSFKVFFGHGYMIRQQEYRIHWNIHRADVIALGVQQKHLSIFDFGFH